MALRRYRAAGGVVIHQGKMLLLDRPSRDEVRLPKGHIEAGETAAQTALRETTEETGYADLLLVHDLGSQEIEFEYQGDHYRRQEQYFLMNLASERQVERSHGDRADFAVRWVEMADAPDELTYESEQSVAVAAVAFVTQGSR